MNGDNSFHLDDCVDALDKALAFTLESWGLFQDRELRAVFIDELIDDFVFQLKGPE